MMIDKVTLWTVMPLLGIGTYLIRLSFLGVLGNRPLPACLTRALRYTAPAVLPGLVAPAVLWPEATGGATDPARLAAAVATLVVGVISKNALGAILAGGAVLYLVPLLAG